MCGGWKHGHVSKDVSDERDGRRATTMYLKISLWCAACLGQRRMQEDIGVGEGFGGSAEWGGGQELHVEKNKKRCVVAMLIHFT